MSSALDACRTIELPQIESVAGSVTRAEGNSEIPFALERVFFLYDVVAGAERGGHAHRLLQQVYVAIMGSFEVVLDDGRDRWSVHLTQPHVGLYVPPMVWSEREYDESEYSRDYAEFARDAGGVAT
jgi:hypothetical protein